MFSLTPFSPCLIHMHLETLGKANKHEEGEIIHWTCLNVAFSPWKT